jgi:adenosine deaminase
LSVAVSRSLSSNGINGEYFADITNQIFERIEASQHEGVEMRISIYGTSPTEWDKLSAWVIENKVFSENNCWLIQVRVRERTCLWCLFGCCVASLNVCVGW